MLTYTKGLKVHPETVDKYIKSVINQISAQEKVDFLFGSGITIYAHFCAALDSIQIILDKEIYAIKFELTFIPDEHEEEIIKLEEILSEYVLTNKK